MNNSNETVFSRYKTSEKHELTETVTAGTSPAQVQTRQNSSTEEMKQTQIPTHDQLIPVRKGKPDFFQRSVTEYIPHSMEGQHKTDPRFLFCLCMCLCVLFLLVFWERKKENMHTNIIWMGKDVGWDREELGKRQEHYQNRLHEKF